MYKKCKIGLKGINNWSTNLLQQRYTFFLFNQKFPMKASDILINSLFKLKKLVNQMIDSIGFTKNKLPLFHGQIHNSS